MSSNLDYLQLANRILSLLFIFIVSSTLVLSPTFSSPLFYNQKDTTVTLAEANKKGNQMPFLFPPIPNVPFALVDEMSRFFPLIPNIAFGQSNTAGDQPSASFSLTVTATCGGGADGTLTGNNQPNTLIGSDNPNTINGNGGDDELLGCGGIDTINGGSGGDTIDGGTGNDIIDGGQGDDDILGGDGDDDILGSGGADTIDGGAGDDDHAERQHADEQQADAGVLPDSGAPGDQRDRAAHGQGGHEGAQDGAEPPQQRQRHRHDAEENILRQNVDDVSFDQERQQKQQCKEQRRQNRLPERRRAPQPSHL